MTFYSTDCQRSPRSAHGFLRIRAGAPKLRIDSKWPHGHFAIWPFGHLAISFGHLGI
jgi:hypothetical protein